MTRATGCAPWCATADGHPTQDPDDRACESRAVEFIARGRVPSGETVRAYLYRRPGADVEVMVDLGDEAGLILPPAEADLLATTLRHLVDVAGGAR